MADNDSCNSNHTFSDLSTEEPNPPSSVPCNLPSYLQWVTCDLRDDSVLSEVQSFLFGNYVEDDDDMFRLNYSMDSLRWALLPPSSFHSCYVGLLRDTDDKLVAFVTAVPALIRLGDAIVPTAEINFLCVRKDHRSRRIAPVMMEEVARRARLEGARQTAYTAVANLRNPVATSRMCHRFLNIKKLVEVGFSILPRGMNMDTWVELEELPTKTIITVGFREMKPRDVPAVTRLLGDYLTRFVVAPCFSEDEVGHWLLPREGVVESFVVEHPDTHQITDFCSFYIIDTAVLENPKHSTIKTAYSYYYAAVETPLMQLINDELVVAKQKGFDVFNALDVMDNESFFKELRFHEGTGYLHYYLHNESLIANTLRPSEIGLVLV